MKCRKTSFSESLDSVERKFFSLDLDGQFEFLEWFKPFAEGIKDGFRRSIVSSLARYLEKKMMKNLDDWLRSEMSLR
ncbi:MAG: hypothetical protein ABWZ66_02130 [Pyrinomonadaceae bacterium]